MRVRNGFFPGLAPNHKKLQAVPKIAAIEEARSRRQRQLESGPPTTRAPGGRATPAAARAAWGSGTAAAALPAPASAASAAAAPDVSIQRWTGPSRGACIVRESGVGVECGRVESRAWALVLAAWWGTVHAAVMRLPGPRRDCNQVNAGGDL